MSLVDTFHIQYLIKEFSRRIASNNQYSLRAYARDLNVSAAWLSQVLNAKKGFSPDKAHGLAQLLDLSVSEKELFVLSSEAHHSRSTQSRKTAFKKLNQLKKTKVSYYKLREAEHLMAVQNWYDNAILEMISLHPQSIDSLFVAKKLGIAPMAAKNSLHSLEKVGLLRKNGEYFVSNHDYTETTQDIPSSSIKEYHKQILKKAEESLFCQRVDEREFQGLVLAFDYADMKDAKEDIRKFREEFAQKYCTQGKKLNSIYQLSVQFFRLDQKEVL